MSLRDHVDIVGTVTNRHSNSLWTFYTNHLNKLSLLLWTDTACKHNIGFLDKLFKTTGDFILAEDFCESLTADNHSNLSFAKL